MENNLRRIETKVNLHGREDKSVWEYLTIDEREAYAEHLASKKHFLSASKFTTDANKKEKFLKLSEERFRL